MIGIWQKPVTSNIPWDSDVPGKVMRKKGKSTVNVLPSSDRWVADFCLTVITSKPRSTNPPKMSSARVANGGGRSSLHDFLGFGIVKYGTLFFPK
jgi:hypothetical protein